MGKLCFENALFAKVFILELPKYNLGLMHLLILIQTVCKRYEETTLADKELYITLLPTLQILLTSRAENGVYPDQLSSGSR